MPPLKAKLAFLRAVRDRPEADDLALGSSQDQRAAQPLHAFAVLHLSHTRTAGRKHDQFGPRQVQGRRFQCGQDAVVITALAVIGAGQREARAQQGVFDVGGESAEPQIRWWLRGGLRVCW
jgi:hypothetical protein